MKKTITTPKRPWKLWCWKTSWYRKFGAKIFDFEPQISSRANKPDNHFWTKKSGRWDNHFGMEGVIWSDWRKIKASTWNLITFAIQFDFETWNGNLLDSQLLIAWNAGDKFLMVLIQFNGQKIATIFSPLWVPYVTRLFVTDISK